MDISVFYAWQSDRPKECNHDLIRDAAQAACDRITDDPANDLVIHLDQDTAGTPGMCDIPNTILEKIRDCDVFLADLTFVGRTDAEVKRAKVVSNPNVLLELGYAVGTKAGEETDGFERVIGVMNVAFGKPEDQMFDIKRRRPISYELPQESDKAAVDRARESLSREIEDALLTILNEAVVPVKGKAGSERFQQIRDQFEASVRTGSFHGLSFHENTIAITLAPERAQELNHAKLQQTGLRAPTLAGWPEVRGRSVVAVDEWGNPSSDDGSGIRWSIAELGVDGTLLAADTSLLHCKAQSAVVSGNEVATSGGEDTIWVRDLGKMLIRSVSHYCKILDTLEVPLPWRLGISLLGVRGYRLRYSDVPIRLPRPCQCENLSADAIVIEDREGVADDRSVGRLLKNMFDYIWREFGFPHCCDYDRDGNWEP